MFKSFLVKALLIGPLLFFYLFYEKAYASDYGTTGLIDIPTARMMEDGVLRSTISKQESVSIYSLNYQATPWFETTFRYAGFEDFFFYDRSYEAKFRLVEETYFFPQVALGIRDIAGTGVFGSEYLVGSKKIGNFDVSLGVGWGRLAGNGDFNNPLIDYSKDFEFRDAETGLGGEFSFSNFFSGEKAGLFGGLSYQFNNIPLTFNVEYNPDNYTYETKFGSKDPKSPVSIGLKWELLDNLHLSANYKHKTQFGFTLSADLDTKKSSPIFPRKAFKSSLIKPIEEYPPGLDPNVWYDRLLIDMNEAGLYLFSANYSEDKTDVLLEIGNKNFSNWGDAISQALALADLHLPKKYSSITFIINENGSRVSSVETIRPSKMFFNNQNSFENQLNITSAKKVLETRNTTSFFQYKLPVDISIQNKTQIMDPDEPFRYQLYAQLGSNIKLTKNLSLKLNFGVDIENNFNTIIRESNSALPPVRSEVKKYLQGGTTGLEDFYISYQDNYFKSVYFRAEAGILEEMFSGIGGEIIYSNFYSRLAFGLSGHYAKKRDYDGKFNHLEYDTFTGFFSTYWASPFYNFDIAFHAGSYLAGDKGGTLEFRRTFDNGWDVGIWATRTNVSAAQFGEGSFDKGIYFKVPLHAIFNRNSRNYYSTRIRPTQRDGGARLEGFSGELWHSLRGVRRDFFENNTERMRP